MIKNIVSMAVIFICTAGYAQDFPKEKYKDSKITWFGIDYTRIILVEGKTIATDAFSDPDKIVNVYFDAWNDFVKLEPSKYDIRKSLMHDNVKIDLSYVGNRNSTVDPDSLVQYSFVDLKKKDLDEVLKAYDFGNKIGIGTMLIAETYNKNLKRGYYHFIIFDIESKTLLFTKQYGAMAQGFGFRNYWARTFYTTLGYIKSDMKKWLK